MMAPIHATTPLRRTAAILLLSASVLSAGCSSSGSSDTYASTETYGAQFATTFADAHPYRKAFTTEEGLSADLLETELRNLGYQPATSDFDEAGNDAVRGGAVPTSRNVVVTIPGTGFRATDAASGATTTERRTIVLCAHYDDALGTDAAETAPGFDGMQDNASGVAALMQAARALKGRPTGFDVVIAFFGAGDAAQAGARHWLASLSSDEVSRIEAVYCVESIYAGDKLYADAGWSSFADGRKYAMRKKLYEATDIALKYRIDLRTNQAGFEVDLLGTGAPVLIREVSTNRSDWVPFDEATVPIVFFESYEYFVQSYDLLLESKNPAFSSTGGKIRGTPLDSLGTLQGALDATRLMDRIDKVAFLLQKIVEKGSDVGVAPITPAPTVPATPTSASGS